MSDRISTKAGVFESGEKDVYGVQYKDGHLISCRNSKLEDYTVADGTEVVCDRAFMNLKDLKSVTLPASVKAIGESAFSGCKSLTDVNIPERVTEIRQATFRDCDALTAIELPASVTEIDKFAFGRELTTLVVHAPEMTIDKYAFMNARDFATLIVPAGRADYYRTLLADIRVKAEVEEIEISTEKQHNMEEEKKMKPVTVEVRGTDENNELMDNLPLIDIRLKEAPVDLIANGGPFPSHENDPDYGLQSYIYEHFSYPPVIVIYYGPEDGDMNAYVLSDDIDHDDAAYNARDFITEEIDREENDDITYYQSSSVKAYGFRNNNPDKHMGTIGVVLNEYADGGNKHTHWYEWNDDVDEVLVRVKFDDSKGEIFKAYSEGGIEMVDINDEEFDEMIRKAK